MGYGYRDGKRNRERRSRTTTERYEWWHKGRCVIVAEITEAGEPVITVKPNFRADGAAKMASAWWLQQILTRLDHEACYQILWGE